MKMRQSVLTLDIKIILLELSKFNKINSQLRYDIEHALRPIPHEWIENYDNALQKELNEYIKFNNTDNEDFINTFNWQQDIIQNSLMWNYLRKKKTAIY